MPPPPDEPLPWFYEDVHFDGKTAVAAQEALKSLATYLDSLATARAEAAKDGEGGVRHGWTGRFRDDFDREFTMTQTQLSDAATALRNYAGSIAEGAEEAARSQWGRETMREQYERDLGIKPSGPR